MFRKFRKVKEEELKAGLATFYNSGSIIAEQYRTVRTNIQYMAGSKKIKSIVITSSESGEGKSVTAANLATVFAKNGDSVLLVDADMRRKKTSTLFSSVQEKNGLSNVLHSKDKDYSSYIQTTPTENLFLLKSGSTPMNPSELLNSQEMDNFLSEMEEIFDLVIFDAPPVVTVTDAQILSTKADGTILVVREGISLKKNVQLSYQLLQLVNSEIIGFIFNDAKIDRKKNGYNYYK